MFSIENGVSILHSSFRKIKQFACITVNEQYLFKMFISSLTMIVYCPCPWQESCEPDSVINNENLDQLVYVDLKTIILKFLSKLVPYRELPYIMTYK